MTDETVAPRAGGVEPNSEGLGEEGPRDLGDLILHTGEARGLADTARHSLESNAPTAPAARSEPPDTAPVHAESAPD